MAATGTASERLHMQQRLVGASQTLADEYRRAATIRPTHANPTAAAAAPAKVTYAGVSGPNPSALMTANTADSEASVIVAETPRLSGMAAE